MSDELLSNIDLKWLSKLFQIPLISVLSKDLFQRSTPKLGSYIVNLDNSTGIGSHWTAFIITKHLTLYFDSFGAPIPEPILQFIKRYNKHSRILYSIDQIQHKSSIYCGYYCIWWLYFITVLHKHCKNYRHLLNRHNMVYSLEDRERNDKILKELIGNILRKI
jgi:hypothetical protein